MLLSRTVDAVTIAAGVLAFLWMQSAGIPNIVCYTVGLLFAAVMGVRNKRAASARSRKELEQQQHDDA